MRPMPVRVRRYARSMTRRRRVHVSPEIKDGFSHPLARKSASSMRRHFGEPESLTRTSWIWYDKTSGGICWEEIELRDEAIPHAHPAPHFDFLYATARLEIPDVVWKEIAGNPRFDSVQYDPLKKRVTVRCAFMTKNVWTYKKLKKMVDEHRALEKTMKTMDKDQAVAPLTNKVS